MPAQYQEYWTRYILPCTYPASEVLQFSSESVQYIGIGPKAPAYVTILTESLCDYLNWITCTWEPLPVYTVTALTTDQQGTEWQPQLHTTINTTGQDLRDHSSLMPGTPQMRTFSQTTLTIQKDERTDKNCQTIVVTLRLRFAVRVKNTTIITVTCQSYGTPMLELRYTCRAY